MSEAIPGITFEPRPASVHDAAVVVLVRGDGADLEVFWVRRGEQVSFSRGFFAFPGGKVDPQDAATPVPGAPPGEEALYACAVRETFEESGVLLAPGAERLAADHREAMRRELLDGTPLSALLEREKLSLDARRLVPAGRWVTPPFSPVRFDARFFLAVVPPGTEASIVRGELTEGAWIRPAHGLLRWDEGSALLHPPNHHTLACLAGFAPEAAVARMRHPPYVGAGHVPWRIEFQRGIHVLPLRTPTLPPATHTNCYIAGTGELAVIDPGSPWPEEQDRLEEHLRELEAEGRRVKYVLLTHHHGDHTGGAVEIARRFHARVLGSRTTAERVPGVEGVLGDGDTVELHGSRPMTLTCLLTEGHARGHLCFLDARSRALLAGDMVAGGSTIVIDPPEGSMGLYLESLRRLRDLGIGTLYPAHGIAMPAGQAKLDEYIAHREMRMTQIVAALREAPRTIGEVVKTVYADTPAFLHPVAERSALASLIELARRGDVRERGEVWEPAVA